MLAFDSVNSQLPVPAHACPLLLGFLTTMDFYPSGTVSQSKLFPKEAAVVVVFYCSIRRVVYTYNQVSQPPN